MTWPHYLASFFAGIALTNAIPHAVKGLTGERFPTPFAMPPGKGLSSPVVNTLWALVNIVIGYFLFRAGRVSSGDHVSLILFFAGITVISLVSATGFAKKHTN